MAPQPNSDVQYLYNSPFPCKIENKIWAPTSLTISSRALLSVLVLSGLPPAVSLVPTRKNIRRQQSHVWTTFGNTVLDPDLRQEENFSRRQVGLANCCLQPPLHGGSYFYHYPFPPISLVHSGWAGPDAFCKVHLGPPQLWRVSFCFCQSLFSVAGYPVCNHILNSRTNSSSFPDTE